MSESAVILRHDPCGGARAIAVLQPRQVILYVRSCGSSRAEESQRHSDNCQDVLVRAKVHRSNSNLELRYFLPSQRLNQSTAPCSDASLSAGFTRTCSPPGM